MDYERVYSCLFKQGKKLVTAQRIGFRFLLPPNAEAIDKVAEVARKYGYTLKDTIPNLVGGTTSSYNLVFEKTKE